MPTEPSTRNPSGTPSPQQPQQGAPRAPQQPETPPGRQQQRSQQPGQQAQGTPQTQQSAQSDKSQVQGEGDYKSNKRYTESVQDFVESGKVNEAAREAKPETEQQAEEMRRAEREGASHAKGDKPRDKDQRR